MGKETEAKIKNKTRWECMKCGEDFLGLLKEPKCPNCGEQIECIPLTPDGGPQLLEMTAVGANKPSKGKVTVINPNGSFQPDLRLNIPDKSPEEMVREAWSEELVDTIRESHLERARARAFEHKEKRLQAERRAKMAEDEGGATMLGGSPEPSIGAIGPSMMLGVIASMPEEQRTVFLEKIEKNPQFAANLGLILNPPQYAGNFPTMMNPYAWNPFTAPPQQYAEREEKQSGSSIKDLAEAMDTMASMMIKLQPNTNAFNETLEVIASQLEGVKQQYHNLALTFTERITAMEKDKEGGKGNKKSDLTMEDIKKGVEDVIEQKGLNKSPVDRLREAADYIRSVEEVKEEFGDKRSKENQEPFEEWLKKTTLQQQEEDKKRAHEEKLKELEVRKAKSEAAKSLINAAVIKGMRKNPSEEEKKEGKVEKRPRISYDNVLFRLAGLSGDSERGRETKSGPHEEERAEEKE